MAWTKQDLTWNVVNIDKINGAAKKPLAEAIAALEQFEMKWAEAKKLLPGAFDGKNLPTLPNGKVARFSLKMQDGEAILKAAAAEPSKATEKPTSFSW